VNDRDRQLANAREDERNRNRAEQRIVKQVAMIRASERQRMTERSDVMDRMDDTGFAPGSLI
jgi:hypothetical protein